MLFLLFSAGVVVFRRPDAFTNPQFFAEDGHYWFADAYHHGIFSTLFLPSAGYLQVLSRIVASISQAFPLSFAPLIFNFSALIIQLLPIFYFTSFRFTRFPLIGRVYVCICYLLFTNTLETYLNITNAQWYLAVSFYLVLIAEPTIRLSWKMLDTSITLLGGLSGPFSLLMLPVVTYLIFRKKLVLSSLKVQLIFFSACLQLLSLLLVGSSEGGRLTHHLLFGMEEMYKIFYRQILWGLISGPFGYDWLVMRIPLHETLFFVSTVVSVMLVLYAVWKADPALKAFLFFAIIVFFCSLLSPTVYSDGKRTVYDVLFDANGIRYWLIPMIGLLVVFVWGIGKKKPKLIRVLSGSFLTLLTFFQIKHLVHLNTIRYPAFADYHWKKEVEEFKKIPKNTTKMFLINPPGWQMTLKKKESFQNKHESL